MSQERIDNLVEKIRHHNFCYFVLNDPEISDDDFDLLYRELKELDENNAVFEESGDIPCYGIKVKHPSLMGSLDKVFNEEEMRKWLGTLSPGITLVVSPKVDGLAVRLEYRQGRLALAATRGRNGTEGQLITDNVRHIASIPQYLGKKVDAEFRGEIYMTKTAFNEYMREAKEKGWKEFKNPRNAAAGTATQKDPEKTARVPLSFFCYEVKVDSEDFATKCDENDWVMTYARHETTYLKYVPLQHIVVTDQIPEIVDTWENKVRSTLDFNIDGLVFMVNENEPREAMGWSSRCPKGAVAYKFQAEKKETEILAIDLQVGRTGVCTPVARVVPTDIDGSTVSSITLHNAGLVWEKGLTIGTKIIFEKAGDIIPKVVSVVSGEGHFKFPANCPSCGEPIGVDENGVNLWCSNKLCPAQLEERIHHYTKRLEILDVGPVVIGDMCKAGLVKSLPDLYRVTIEQLSELTGGTRSAEKVINSIHSKKDVDLDVFLSSLGVSGLGRTTGKNLAREFETLERVRELQYDELIPIDDIGPITATQIENGLQRIAEEIDDILQYINVVPNIKKEGNLSGKSFCITGSLQKPKKVVYKMIEDAGGETKTSVGRGLDYLIQADPTKESGKSKKAVKLGVAIISEEELMEMIR